MSFDAERIRRDFPVLQQSVHGKPLAFLDTAASAQKPQCVIDAVSEMYSRDYANVHRGVYELSLRATRALDDARERIARFLGAADPREIVFVRNATEAINLVARSLGDSRFGPGDEIVLSEMEHHSNIVPWQMLCERRGCVLRVAPIDDRGALRLDAFEALLSPRTRLVALSHVSNVLGTVNPIDRIVALCRARGALLCVDGAQAAPHLPVDVQSLGCDFYALSGHKLYGPSGIGVLWARAELLESMPPFLGGGGMIASVHFEKTTYAGIPARFEAGTPDIAGAVGLGAAVAYVERIGMDAVARHEHALGEYAAQALANVPGLRVFGTAPGKAAVYSFELEGVHPHDVGTILDAEGVAVRAGHHCAQPLMERFGVPAMVRASLALYNTRADVDALVRGLARVREVFA
ncbi:MAG TPA: cysteine desulfurase [Myxococcota bacterium]|nr:cysteine desulfurase [Myxococcota bacterium]